MSLCVKSCFCSAFIHYILPKSVSEEAFSGSGIRTPANMKRSPRDEKLPDISLFDQMLFV